MHQDRRDPARQLIIPNGRRHNDDPPLAMQAIHGFPRLPNDKQRVAVLTRRMRY
jgi:hypothetical protein